MFTISCRKFLFFYFLISLVFTSYCFSAEKDGITIGVYYFPGWKDKGNYHPWEKIKSYPEREPLIGYYPEGVTWVAEKQIEFASSRGIDFFAYEWWWNGSQSQPHLDHALKAHLKAKNRDKLQFALLWCNNPQRVDIVPQNLEEFDAMVNYWIENYFSHPAFCRIDGKPVIFVHSSNRLSKDADRFGFKRSGKPLLLRARAKAKEKGHKGIYFVALTNDRPSNSIEKDLLEQGYDAYSAWNYVVSEDKSMRADYDAMVDTYIHFYDAASKTAKGLPYIVPASPGWDVRPWRGKDARVRENSTPEKFKRMLKGAKELLDSPRTSHKILMIEAWNEIGEGAYIEPTKKWEFKYLETIRDVFRGK